MTYPNKVRFKTALPSTGLGVNHVGLRKGKKNKAPAAPAPGLPLPPLPGMPPLPAPPGAPAADAPLPLPPAPAPGPAMPLPDAPTPTAEPSPWATAGQEQPSVAKEENKYGDLWAKRSEKPLPQIYGHIDRISSADAGSLLDRYADRFGHSLDRDIIVLRKKEHDDKVSEVRDAPVVELIEDDEDDLATQLLAIENELRSLRPEYQEAKASGDAHLLSELRPVLQNLMAERKNLQALIAGEGDETPTTAQEVSDEEQDEDDLFVSFVAIVDDLLGSNLPADVVNTFLASEEFAIYQEVGSDPSNADDDLRAAFFGIVDGQLGNMADEDIDAFVSSAQFSIYSAVGAQYQ